MLRIVGLLTIGAALIFGALYVTGDISGSAKVELTEQGEKRLQDTRALAEESVSSLIEN